MKAAHLSALCVCAGVCAAFAQDAQHPGQGRDVPIVFGDPGEHAYTLDFFPGATYDESIPTPASVLGVPAGTRPASHREVRELWQRWDEASPRAQLETTGLTFEGRELMVGVISSAKNMAQLDSILELIGKLAHPGTLESGELESILPTIPTVAWLGYSIHGDEMSGVDGGLAFAYHLIAGTGADVTELLERVIVVIDPMMNPDGRERFLAMLHQNAGSVPNLNVESLHRGRWPNGRGNHYLFDMNRDWMGGIMPETRARWHAARRFHPQLFVDAHEMSSLDTYLFSPPREPLNPNLPRRKTFWNELFANEQAAAFDRWGWSYYTREWFESWYPGYSDAWGSLQGAIGILYEQASRDGQSLRRASGEVVTYREAAHHQAVSSLANVQTLVRNADEVLRSYASHRSAYFDSTRSVALVPGDHPSRLRYLVETLIGQGIEVSMLGEAAVVRNVEVAGADPLEEKTLPAGTIVIPMAQPAGALVAAYFELDPRFKPEVLLDERRELEKKGRSKIYDVTAWNLGLALDFEVYWTDEALRGVPVVSPREPVGGIDNPDSNAVVYGWIVDGSDDASVVFSVRAMELGLKLNLAERAFSSAGRTFPRGSLLIRRHENDADAAAKVERAAREAGVRAIATSSARSPDEGPDLGGGRFSLLARPRVALVSNAPVRSDSFGHLWHHLDQNLGLPTTLIDAQSLGSYDLRRYNVLVFPPTGGSMRSLVEPIAEDIEAWVRSGGTLIAMGSSAAIFAAEKPGLSAVRRRRDVLEEIDEYLFAARREAAAEAIEIDERDLWEAAAAEGEPETDTDADEKADKQGGDSSLEREDAWKRRFSPHGVILRGRVDTDAWITSGCSEVLPVFFDGSDVLMSRWPVRTPVRLAPEAHLRISGLVWPEARERLAMSAWLTVERAGRGQVILFAAQPGFRGVYKANARLFSNAVVFGPGAGASQPLGW